MIMATQLMAGARPPTQLAAAPSKHLSPSFSRSHPNSNYPTTINLSYNQRPRAFPRFSLSRNNESRLSSFPTPGNKLKYNSGIIKNESRFLALALANSDYDDESRNEKEAEEEVAMISSALKEEVAVKIPSYVKLVLGVALKGQFLCFIFKACIFAHIFLFTGLITSPATFCATAGGLISANISLYLDFFMCKLLHKVEEQRLIGYPLEAPLRNDIMRHIKYTIPLNLCGLGATIFGMLHRFGLESGLYYCNVQYANENYNVVDFCRKGLLEASKGAVVCHLLGLASSIVLLRWVTKPPSTSSDDLFSFGWFWSWPA